MTIAPKVADLFAISLAVTITAPLKRPFPIRLAQLMGPQKRAKLSIMSPIQSQARLPSRQASAHPGQRRAHRQGEYDLELGLLSVLDEWQECVREANWHQHEERALCHSIGTFSPT